MKAFRLLLLLLLAPLGLAAHAGKLGGDFDRLEESLQLNPVQKEQFHVAIDATHRALVSLGLSALQMKGALGQELLKDEPDGRALAEAQEQLIERNRPLFRAAREEWARFYALLHDDQVEAARAFVEKKLRRLELIGEAVREILRERSQRK